MEERNENSRNSGASPKESQAQSTQMPERETERIATRRFLLALALGFLIPPAVVVFTLSLSLPSVTTVLLFLGVVLAVVDLFSSLYQTIFRASPLPHVLACLASLMPTASSSARARFF